MHTLRRQLSWCALILLVGLAVWIYWPGDLAVLRIQRAGGTVQLLTSSENRGRAAVCLPDTVTDEDLEQMSSLDELRPVWLQLRGRQITGRGIKSLRRLTSLRGLNLNGTSITDDDLLELQAFPELTTLNLDGSRISPRALQYLKQLPKLRCVSLRWTTLHANAVQRFQADWQNVTVLSEFTDRPDE